MNNGIAMETTGLAVTGVPMDKHVHHLLLCKGISMEMTGLVVPAVRMDTHVHHLF